MRLKISEALKFIESFDLKELYSKFPSSEKEWKTEIWLKHPNERLSDYKLFAENYLPIPTVYRSVRLAFHIHIYLNPREEGMTWQEAIEKAPTSFFYDASKGLATFADSSRNIHPKMQIVPYSWQDRALAYDKVKRRVQLDDIIEIRNRIVKGELEYTLDALDLFDKMFYAWREKMLETGTLFILPEIDNKESITRLVESNKSDGGTVDIRDIKQLRDLTIVRNEISEYARRALGMPNIVKDDALGENQEIEVEFVDLNGGVSETPSGAQYVDDISTEELLKQLNERKTV